MNELMAGDSRNQEIEDVERSLLGSILLEPDQFVNISHLLRADMFIQEAHSIIYNRFNELYVNNKPIDLITLTEYVKFKGELEKVGGMPYLSRLMENVASAAHIETHARIIMDYSCKRRVYHRAIEIQRAASDPSYTLDEVVGLINSFEEDTVTHIFNHETTAPISEYLANYCAKANEPQKTDYLVPVIESVYEYVTTWKGGELIIVAGRPGMGKTAFVLYELVQQAKHGHNILFFSIEMKGDELMHRILSMETGIIGSRIEYYNLSSEDWVQVDNSVAKLEQLGFYIDDRAHMDINYILTQAKIYKKKYDIGAIAVDYLQLIALPSGENRAVQIGECTRKLKVLARTLDVPLFLICQLNRQVENRQSKNFEPVLSDLRESGSIEQDADKVLFPIRLAYYFADDPRLRHKGLVKIAKNRKGKVGKALVTVSEDVTRWTHRVGTGDDLAF